MPDKSARDLTTPDFAMCEQEVEVAWAALIAVVRGDKKKLHPVLRALNSQQWEIAAHLLDRMTSYFTPAEPPRKKGGKKCG